MGPSTQHWTNYGFSRVAFGSPLEWSKTYCMEFGVTLGRVPWAPGNVWGARKLKKPLRKGVWPGSLKQTHGTENLSTEHS